MSTENTTAADDFWGPPIHAYTVVDAVADGAMVPLPESYAKPSIPVVFTSLFWNTLIGWDDDDPRLQDETGRLHDVMWMSQGAVRRAVAAPGERAEFVVLTLERTDPDTGERSNDTEPRERTGHVLVQAYDATGTKPCLTFLLPKED